MNGSHHEVLSRQGRATRCAALDVSSAMPTDKSGPGSDLAKWRVGQRVSRKDSRALGTVAEVSEHVIKIKWDSGGTSYYRRDSMGNVLLKQSEQ